MMNPPYFNLSEIGFPNKWERCIRNLVAKKGIITSLNGESETSLAQSGTTSVQVVTGEEIKEELPWLWHLYTMKFLEFAASSFDKKLFIANDLTSSININFFEGLGAGYEWHRDTNTVTGVLFVTDHDSHTGGLLEFENLSDQNILLSPQKGLFTCFDARKITHRVTPLKIDTARISIPMNYYDTDKNQYRPSGLNQYLYTGNQ